MDAMVTGRMPAGKKEAGNVVLRELGMSASQAINWLWDYLISQRKLPQESDRADISQEKMAAALSFVDGFPQLEVSDDLLVMDVKQARAERLDERYGGQEASFYLVDEKDFR